MTKELLYKYLNDGCTDEELNEVIEYFKAHGYNVEDKELAWQLWKSLSNQDEYAKYDNYDALLDSIHHKINLEESLRISSHNSSSGFLLWLTRVAALMLLPVLGYMAYTNLNDGVETVPSDYPQASQIVYDTIEITAPIGSKTTVQLSDGSTVFLNHGSKLRYPLLFSEVSREVTLTGEGYFVVAHDSDRPFNVSVDHYTVRATGTEFNLMAYPDEDIIETTLIEGEVFFEESSYEDAHIIQKIQPNTQLSFDKRNNEVLVSKDDVKRHVQWKDGKLVFNNDSMLEITNRLSRWYNVEFRIEDEELRSYPFSATFSDESLFQILDLMRLATPIDYTVSSRKKLPDGTFSKQVITIFKR